MSVQNLRKNFNAIAHFEVRLSDVNGDRGGELDKRCMIEARPAGFKPVAVTHKADNIDLAIHGAIDKLKRTMEHSFAKTDHGRGARPDWSETTEA